MRKYISESLKDEIVDFYKQKPMSISVVSSKFDLCNVTVSRILKSRNVELYGKNKIFNPNLNEHFFDEIDTEEKAYFLGLIVSDGNVYNPRESVCLHGGSIWTSITLTDGDSYILERFRIAVGASNHVSSDGRGSSYIAIRSDVMGKSLEKYGIVPRKSFVTYFPTNIPENMVRHFVRGLIDGDGSIDSCKLYDSRNRYRHRISLCGTHRLMVETSEVIMKTLNLENKINVYDYKNRVLSEFKVTKIGDMYKLGEWLYKDSTIFLTRKHDKYVKFKEHYGLT